MAGSAQHVIRDFDGWRRAYWLPPGGWGNGLESDSWAAMADVSTDLAATLILFELRRAGVPGYAAALHRRFASARRDTRRHTGAQRVRIWVGCDAYGRAESTLLRILPELNQQFGGRVLA